MFTTLTTMCSNVGRIGGITCSLNRTKWIHTSSIDFAARKGTREKARKKKVAKVEEKKVGFIPHNIRARNKLAISKVDKHFNDSSKPISCDNVYITKYYQRKLYDFVGAVELHRETHHPTVYNVPDATLNVKIELNMQAEKITRFVDKFRRIALIPHGFDQQLERTTIVFCKGDAEQSAAIKAGATMVGGPELVKDVQSGEINLNNFNFVIAHPNILPELVSIRGLMKKRFPNIKSGNLGVDIADLVTKFNTGIQYTALRDEHQLNYGYIDTCIGTLDMDIKKLEENLIALLKDVNSVRPKREGDFIRRVTLGSPPSREMFQMDPFVYISREYEKVSKDNLDESEEEPEKLAEAN